MPTPLAGRRRSNDSCLRTVVQTVHIAEKALSDTTIGPGLAAEPYLASLSDRYNTVPSHHNSEVCITFPYLTEHIHFSKSPDALTPGPPIAEEKALARAVTSELGRPLVVSRLSLSDPRRVSALRVRHFTRL